MTNKFLKNDDGELVLVNEGDFGAVILTVRQPEAFEVDATIIAVNRHGEVEVLLGKSSQANYPYTGERSWVRVGDGKVEHPKHWVVGGELERLVSIYEQNQPVATVAELGVGPKP